MACGPTRPPKPSGCGHSAGGGQPGHRRIRSLAHLGTAALLVGGLVLTTAGTGHAATSNPVQADASGSTVALTSGVTTTRPAFIPDAALLQPEDLRGASMSPADDDSWPGLRPPQPCADGTYRSTALRRTDRAASALVGVDERPTVVVEYLAIYRANGAHRYLRELRRALNRCHGIDEQGNRWKILATGVAGRDSMLLRLRERFEFAGEIVTKNTYLAVARVGRALVMVADVGWEISDGHRALVRELITPAVRRARILR